MSSSPPGLLFNRAWKLKPSLRLALALTLLSTTLVQGKQQTPSNSSPTTPILDVNPLADDDVCATLWSRQECGFLGITKDGCQQRQCCWSPTLAPVPWCFQKKNEEYLCAADVVTRRDCGFLGIDSKGCYDRNCCWDPTPNNLNAPFCFLKQHSCKGYEVKSVEESATGTMLHLGLLGGPQGCSRFGQDIPNLAVHIDYETESRVRVKIIDSNNKRYEIPAFALPDPESTARRNVTKRDYTVRYTKSPFTFAVTRVSTGEVIFDSSVAGMDSLVFEDEYLEISSVLPEDANIFGLGEVVTAFRRDPRGTRQTMWARDAATPVDENLYGSHPFHLEMRNGIAHGVFLRNSNGMDVIITPKKITYKVIGGILDFTIFLGPKPADVVEQYTELIGRPHMPPAWSLGFHQSRYGYGNIGEVEQVVQRYRQENLPLDGVWIDIDYMDSFKDFSYDETKFPKARIRSLATDLNNHNQSMVLIIDPGIPIAPGYEPYDTGMKEDIFIKTLTGKPIEGRVWPGQTYFPDFMNTNETWAFWQRQLHKTREDIGQNVYPWIDMNEPSNFCNGPCTKDSPGFNPALDKENAANAFLTNALADRNKDVRIPSEVEILEKRGDAAPINLKYAINNAGRQAPLDEKTLAENAVHKNGLRLTDTHNLYGHMEAMATHHSLLQLKPDTRPFILTRSSFSGTGAYAAKWTGDNWSEWSHLYFSVPGILSFGLFGVPFTGADICGFIGNTTEELCLRWHQLGSLYPFARNHNTIGASSQEPYVWPNSVLPAARKALQIRYSLLPYMYTLFGRAHKTGNPVWRPLFFGFPQDPSFVLKIDRQFLLGDGILVSPALYKGQIQVKAYFPGKGRWFDLWTHQCVIEADRDQKALKLKARAKATAEDERPHRYKFLPAKVESDPIPMSLEGGHIIPIHQTTKLTVAETRLQPLGLIVALDETGFAQGGVYVDDGTSVNNQNWANVTWELHSGKQLISNALLKWPGQSAGSQGAGVSGSRLEEMSAAQAQAFRAQMGHSDRIEKIVVMGLNFARFGGEQDLDPNVAASQVFFDVTGASKLVGGPQERQQLRRQGQNRGQGQHGHRRRSADVEEEQDIFFTDAEAAAQSPHERPIVAARVNALQELNINGAPISFGGEGGVAPVNRTKGVDAATGLGWEVNEAAGSLTLTGLKIDLFAGWFIHWKLE